MAREKKEASAPAGCPAWLATYGDMVTLLLTFFVLLFSFSTIDAQKWEAIVAALGNDTLLTSINNAPAVIVPQVPSIFDSIPDVEIPFDENPDVTWEALFQKMTEIANNVYEETGHEVLIEYTDATITILLPNSMLFDSGRADLKQNTVEVLRDIMDIVIQELGLIQGIRIEGHTDTDKLTNTSLFRDNMDLSYARSDTVYRAIIDEYPSIPRVMFSVAGQGEYHPVFDPGDDYPGENNDNVAFSAWLAKQNSTPERKARNRRAVITLERYIKVSSSDTGN